MFNDDIDLQSLTLIKLGGKKRDQGLSQIYKKYADKLRRFFYYQTSSKDDADDLVQETFIKVVRHCETYRGDALLSSWVWQIARNSLTDYLRRKNVSRTKNLDDEEWELLEQKSESMHFYQEIPPDGSMGDCVSKGFQEFAKTQPDRAYALSLVVDGYDSRSIAKFINRTEGATREYLSQCRKKIEEFLAPCKQYLA